MKSIKTILLNFGVGLLIFGGMQTGCEKGVFSRSEPVVSKTISFDPFEEIVINGIFEIELRNDSVFSVRLTGRESILENISAKVNSNSLELYDNNSYKWLPDYQMAKLLISFPEINTIDIKAASKIFSKDLLNVDRLSLLAGAQLIDLDLTVNATDLYLRTGTDNYGHYTLRGYSENIELWIFGSAQLWADDLVTRRAKVRNYSIGDCHVNVYKKLMVWLEHYGNIYYYGYPEEIIIETENSAGELIQME